MVMLGCSVVALAAAQVLYKLYNEGGNVWYFRPAIVLFFAVTPLQFFALWKLPFDEVFVGEAAATLLASLVALVMFREEFGTLEIAGGISAACGLVLFYV